MLGEFYCFLNVPLEELTDLKDRLHHFVKSAGPKESPGEGSRREDSRGFLARDLHS
jgi:hypothetical protein